MYRSKFASYVARSRFNVCSGTPGPNIATDHIHPGPLHVPNIPRFPSRAHGVAHALPPIPYAYPSFPRQVPQRGAVVPCGYRGGRIRAPRQGHRRRGLVAPCVPRDYCRGCPCGACGRFCGASGPAGERCRRNRNMSPPGRIWDMGGTPVGTLSWDVPGNSTYVLGVSRHMSALPRRPRSTAIHLPDFLDWYLYLYV